MVGIGIFIWKTVRRNTQATAATNQLGKEADIFKAVLWHSIFLAVIVGLMTLLQAYVFPFTRLVPTPPR